MKEEKEMYIELNDAKYKSRPFETHDLGEGMAVINCLMFSWWKPRFILNHNEKTAFEFVGPDECLTTVTENDIDWDSLKGLPQKVINRARRFDFHFPSFVHRYQNGISEVSWQLNPEGYYYMDDDGFGMSDDIEITINGFIDVYGNVIKKFKLVKNSNELDDMRREAEKIIAEKKDRTILRSE